MIEPGEQRELQERVRGLRWWFVTLWLIVGVIGGCKPDAILRSRSSSTTPDRVRPTGAPEELPVLELGEAFDPGGPALRDALRPLFEKWKLVQKARKATGAKREVLSVLHLGDSHVASDTITAEIRARWQRRLGDAGRGYVYPGLPWRSFRQEDMSYKMGGKWEVFRGMRSGDQGVLGMGGVRLVSNRGSDWVTRGAPTGKLFYQADIFHHKVQGGGSFRVTVDGADLGTVSTALPAGATGPEPATHTIQLPQGGALLRVETVGDGPVHLTGVSTETNTSGVAYHSLGLNGAKASTFLGFDEQATIAEVRRINPDLLVMAFGTNEAYNLRARELKQRHYREHKKHLRQLIQRYRKGAPNAACLVLLPMDIALKPTAEVCFKEVQVTTRRRRGRRRTKTVRRLDDEVDLMQHPECAWRTPDSLHLIRKASLDAARAEQCAVWDIYTAMGGQGSMRTWAQLSSPLSRSDGVHLTMRGYRYLGRRLQSDLTTAYRRWSREGDATLRTTPWTPPPVTPAAP